MKRRGCNRSKCLLYYPREDSAYYRTRGGEWWGCIAATPHMYMVSVARKGINEWRKQVARKLISFKSTRFCRTSGPCWTSWFCILQEVSIGLLSASDWYPRITFSVISPRRLYKVNLQFNAAEVENQGFQETFWVEVHICYLRAGSVDLPVLQWFKSFCTKPFGSSLRS